MRRRKYDIKDYISGWALIILLSVFFFKLQSPSGLGTKELEQLPDNNKILPLDSTRVAVDFSWKYNKYIYADEIDQYMRHPKKGDWIRLNEYEE